MTHANVRFNYHDYLQLPDDKRYEIIDGELLVVPAPYLRHQRILRELATALCAHVKERDSGQVFFAPCDVVLSAENVVQPDLLFVTKERQGILTEANIQGPPDLAIEILSEATRQRDLHLKRKLYAKYGVREYWIVDPDAATVEVLVRGEPGYISAGVYGCPERLSSPLLPELNLPVSEIFTTAEHAE